MQDQHMLRLLVVFIAILVSHTAFAETQVSGTMTSQVFSSPSLMSDSEAFNTAIGDLTADVAITNNTATSSGEVSITQAVVPGETNTTVFNFFNLSLNTAAAPSGVTSKNTGIVNIFVENETTYDFSGSFTMASTNGTGSANLFLRQGPPGPFIYSNANTGASQLITELTTLQISDTNSSGTLMPNINYRLEWVWEVSRAFGRDPITGSGGFQLVLVEDISFLIGDIDGDGHVGAGDMDLILSNWGSAGTIADIDSSGHVSQGDLDLVLDNWGDGTPPSTLVPEPSALAIFGLAGVLVLRRKR